MFKNIHIYDDILLYGKFCHFQLISMTSMFSNASCSSLSLCHHRRTWSDCVDCNMKSFQTSSLFHQAYWITAVLQNMSRTELTSQNNQIIINIRFSSLPRHNFNFDIGALVDHFTLDMDPIFSLWIKDMYAATVGNHSLVVDSTIGILPSMIVNLIHLSKRENVDHIYIDANKHIFIILTSTK